MAGLLSGLAGLGLDDLEDVQLFEDEAKEKAEGEKVVVKLEEKDFLLDRNIQCPVCDKQFSNKIVKSGKARLLGSDPDLRPRHEGIDTVKYDVELCPNCGYAALTRFFPHVTDGQIRLIKEHISKKVHLHPYEGETYTYEEALERYKLALASAIVKRARPGEKAYICLKCAWLLRGHAESLAQEEGDSETDTQEQQSKLKALEEEYLLNAFEGFCESKKKERFPICGMDEVTLDYLLAVLAIHLKRFEEAGRLISRILNSSFANIRMKDKARDLKTQLLAEIKAKKAEEQN